MLLNSPRPRLHLVLCKQRRRLGSTGGQEHSGHQTTQRQVGPINNRTRGVEGSFIGSSTFYPNTQNFVGKVDNIIAKLEV